MTDSSTKDKPLQSAIATSNKYNGKASNHDQLMEELETSVFKRYVYVLKQTWVQLLNIILIYFVSLSLFPAVHARIEAVDNIISQKYFAPVFCFLLFNLFATIGNSIAQFIQWPGPKYLIIFTVARLAFIPFFLYCNYQPGDAMHMRTLPIMFHRDWMYIVGAVSMAVTSGYLSSLTMMYVPGCVVPKYSSMASMIAALIIILGILAGINFSLLYPVIVRHKWW